MSITNDWTPPQSWTDNDMDWSSPDPSNLNYIYALIEAINERISVIKLAENDETFKGWFHGQTAEYKSGTDFIGSFDFVDWRNVKAYGIPRAWRGAVIDYWLFYGMFIQLLNLSKVYIAPERLQQEIDDKVNAYNNSTEDIREIKPLSFMRCDNPQALMFDDVNRRFHTDMPIQGTHISLWAEWIRRAKNYLDSLYILEAPATLAVSDGVEGYDDAPTPSGNWWDDANQKKDMYFSGQDAYSSAIDNLDDTGAAFPFIFNITRKCNDDDWEPSLDYYNCSISFAKKLTLKNITGRAFKAFGWLHGTTEKMDFADVQMIAGLEVGANELATVDAHSHIDITKETSGGGVSPLPSVPHIPYGTNQAFASANIQSFVSYKCEGGFKFIE